MTLRRRDVMGEREARTQGAGAAAGEDRDALHGRRSLREDDRVGIDQAAHLAHEGLDRYGLAHPPAGAPGRERALDLDLELAGEERVVAELRVRVEGEVV